MSVLVFVGGEGEGKGNRRSLQNVEKRGAEMEEECLQE